MILASISVREMGPSARQENVRVNTLVRVFDKLLEPGGAAVAPHGARTEPDMTYRVATAFKDSRAPVAPPPRRPVNDARANHQAEEANGAHVLQAIAATAVSEWTDESSRWSRRASLGVTVTSSLFLWALLGVIVF